MPEISRDEFVEGCARRSRMDPIWLLGPRAPVLCDCGEGGCQGWKMVPAEDVDVMGMP